MSYIRYIRHNKDIKDMEPTNTPYNPEVPSRVLVNGSAFATFFEQKVLKIAHALYLVSSYIPNDEPLRSALRGTALQIVSALHGTDLSGGASVLHNSFEPLFG